MLAPSTNSIVEADFNRMHVPGVTPLFSRIHIYDQDLSSEAQMEKLRVQLDESIDHAIDLVITAEVDYMVMGMSAETFWDGKDGNERFKARVKERSGGLDVATGAEACERALNKFGVKTIGIVTPYQANGDRQVIGFFEELGFEVTKLIGLKRPTAVSIAHTTEDELREALLDLDRTEPDALVQVDQPVDGPPRRRGRALAAQAGHRDQRRRPGGWRCATTASRTSSTASVGCSRSSERADRAAPPDPTTSKLRSSTERSRSVLDRNLVGVRRRAGRPRAAARRQAAAGAAAGSSRGRPPVPSAARRRRGRVAGTPGPGRPGARRPGVPRPRVPRGARTPGAGGGGAAAAPLYAGGAAATGGAGGW